MTSVRAEALASALRRDLGITDKFFDLEGLVREAGVEILKGEPAGAVEGMSLALGGREVIWINQRVTPPARQRFTLAHEFGHHLLGHSVACTGAMIGGPGSDMLEQEANAFASSLLMPASLFRQDIKRLSARFELISSLAADYGVSLTAAAIRYVKLTLEPCALLCVGGTKPWLVKSNRAAGFRVSLEIPDGSLVADCATDGRGSDASAVAGDLWIENLRGSQQIWEDVQRIGDSLWLVLLADLPDPDDDPDFEDRAAERDLESRRNSFRRY